MCHVLPVTCPLPFVKCHLSLTITAKATYHPILTPSISTVRWSTVGWLKKQEELKITTKKIIETKKKTKIVWLHFKISNMPFEQINLTSGTGFSAIVQTDKHKDGHGDSMTVSKHHYLGFLSIWKPFIIVPKGSFHGWEVCKSGNHSIGDIIHILWEVE